MPDGLAVSMSTRRTFLTGPRLNVWQPVTRLSWKVLSQALRCQYPSSSFYRTGSERSCWIYGTRRVQRTPHALALQDRSEKLTYDQLNRRANKLAFFLQAQGVGPDKLVGVCLEPSAEMVVALLGIFKAGGAYLPLDLDYPRDRPSLMLADAQPVLVLTRQGLRQRLPEGQRLVCIDMDDEQWGNRSQANPISEVTPDHLAYVIYTSGSTGQPKAASLMHRGVVNLLADFQRRRPISPGDVCSWWTSPSFDVSVYEIFSPLLAGGCLDVIPLSVRLNSAALLEWLKTHAINSAYLPPFLLPDLAYWAEANPGSLTLRRLLVGVEPILYSLLTRILSQQSDLQIINGYGPNETTICSTLYEVKSSHLHSGITPIGRPAANTQVFLLDAHRNLIPIGAVGDVYIGGEGLARGYYRHPDLTAERFIESPFRPGERLYRAGDLARYLPDGNLIYMGRVDTQVKLHGMRLELGEIEAALHQHPKVKQAAVMLQEQPSGTKSLVAYIIPNQLPLNANNLRHDLIQRLPQTMIPIAFVMMDSFPLTPTGKLDRKAFPLPDHTLARPENRYRAPQTATEQSLVMIWQQVLQVERVGLEDNFFELGGDSILSVHVVAKARELGLQINPQAIFQMPTIAELSVLVDQARATHHRWDIPALGERIPLTPIQAWFFLSKIFRIRSIGTSRSCSRQIEHLTQITCVRRFLRLFGVMMLCGCALPKQNRDGNRLLWF